MFIPNIENINKSNNEKYPIITLINNINKEYKINQPILNHLSSYGFIIIVYNDRNTIIGKSTEKILNNKENTNNNK